jgi:16S rRNA G966 N2-methylase RsmD
MLPQLGIDILKEFNISKGHLLDPYCGSGSSFICGIECGLSKMSGFDINPLAVLISKVKYTVLNDDEVSQSRQNFRNKVFELLKDENKIQSLPVPQITNMDFWFSTNVTNHLSVLMFFIEKIKNVDIKNIFLLAFSETVRACSYTRNNEFKLYRMKDEDMLNFNPDVVSVFFKYFDEIYSNYKNFYYPKINKGIVVNVENKTFTVDDKMFDVVLTSPPYGDSRTTVAYGQFSTLSNEWLGINYARKIDAMLMGGAKVQKNISGGIIADYISEIEIADKKRALDVSSFYMDLHSSINNVASSVKKGGKIIYVVGNRTVKNVQLPTDQFIAEKFEENGFKHLITYERALSNKAMPSRNSPTNVAGKTVNTMLYEYIVVCEK